MNSIVIPFRQISPHVRYVNVSQYRPGQVEGPRKVYDHQFIYVHGGEGIMEINGVAYTAQPGDLFFYGPSVVHRFIGATQNPFYLWGVHFDFTQSHIKHEFPIGPFKLEYFQEQNVNEKVEFTDFVGFLPHINLLHDYRVPEIQLKMLDEYTHGQKFHNNYLNGLMASLLAIVARHTDIKIHGMEPCNDMAKHVITYIHTHYNKNLSNENIGKHFHFHANYLSKLVKAHTGKSLRQYLIDVRVKKAVDLIMYSDMNLKQISHEIGYDDIHYFSRLVKNKTGLSPMQIKERL